MRLSLIGAFFALATLPTLAQTPEGTPTRIRGTVAGVEGQTVMVKSAAGQDVPVTMAADARITGVVKRSLSDIRAGDAIASTSVRGSDGKLHALELHFLPPGANEGQFPTDLAPGSLMTNAAVAGIAAAPQGQVLRVTYKGQEAEIIVPPDVPVVAFVPADMSLVKPGAAIIVSGVRKPDGSVVATRATLEKDGVKPPM
ncbi:hypothetical protein [Microvirga yunnanensis]|uniref:hypothetical protein n=1 Tax=Microvirga yunnanensis TaxID=2953740 RepID=UPI0021C64339|nr:hypothetical protein [Microvirga sp. HBU65207]